MKATLKLSELTAASALFDSMVNAGEIKEGKLVEKNAEVKI